MSRTPRTQTLRQRKPTDKEVQNATERVEKEKAASQKKLKQALRSKQQDEEDLGFHRDPRWDPPSQTEKLPVESEDEEGPEDDDIGFMDADTGGKTFACITTVGQRTKDKATPPFRRVTSDRSTPRLQPIIMHTSKGDTDVEELSDVESAGITTPKATARLSHSTPSVVSKPLVRKTSPVTTSAETTVVTKRIKIEGKKASRKVRVSDFDELSKTLTEEAIDIYRAQLFAVEPWPSKADNRDVIRLAWVEVCRSRKLQAELDKDIYQAISSRSSTARGELKTLLKRMTLSHLGVDTKASKRTIRDRIEFLLEGESPRFLYKDPNNQKGIFMSELIQVLINEMWFKDRNGEGIISPEFSEGGMVPMVTVALVLTAIENTLDEWATGEHTEVQFSSAKYKSHTATHLERLQDFNKKTSAQNIVPRMLTRMLKAARKHAKVDNASNTTASTRVSDADAEAAMQEWAEMGNSDDE